MCARRLSESFMVNPLAKKVSYFKSATQILLRRRISSVSPLSVVNFAPTSTTLELMVPLLPTWSHCLPLQCHPQFSREPPKLLDTFLLPDPADLGRERASRGKLHSVSGCEGISKMNTAPLDMSPASRIWIDQLSKFLWLKHLPRSHRTSKLIYQLCLFSWLANSLVVLLSPASLQPFLRAALPMMESLFTILQLLSTVLLLRTVLPTPPQLLASKDLKWSCIIIPPTDCQYLTNLCRLTFIIARIPTSW